MGSQFPGEAEAGEWGVLGVWITHTLEDSGDPVEEAFAGDRPNLCVWHPCHPICLTAGSTLGCAIITSGSKAAFPLEVIMRNYFFSSCVCLMRLTFMNKTQYLASLPWTQKSLISPESRVVKLLAGLSKVLPGKHPSLGPSRKQVCAHSSVW